MELPRGEMNNKTKDSRKEVIDYYSTDEWREAIDRALLFIVKFQSNYANAPTKDPKEWVADAVSKLISGERAWNPNKYSLPQHLIHTFRSDFSHFLSVNNKFVQLENAESAVSNIAPPETPEEKLMQQEQVQLKRKKVAEVREKIKKTGDAMAIKMFEAYENDQLDRHNNRALAKIMDVEVKHVVNAKKRIKRILSELEGL